MILDELLEFADNTSVAAGAGTALIGDVIDLSSTSSDFGNGEEIYVVIKTGATEIITGGTAGTILFQVASDAQAAIATDGTATVHLTSATLVTDDAAVNSSALNAGESILVAALPKGTYERYLGILCTIATETVTAGTIDAFLTKDPGKYFKYPDAIA
jgi:hypothetical protein